MAVNGKILIRCYVCIVLEYVIRVVNVLNVFLYSIQLVEEVIWMYQNFSRTSLVRLLHMRQALFETERPG